MKYIHIKNTDLKVSEVGLGCMRIANMEEQMVDSLIKEAIDLGINFFDHADIYGKGESENIFGKILLKDQTLRDKMIIQSKCGIRQGYYDFSKEHIINSVDGILKRLNIDYLDTLLLHRPDTLMEPTEVAEAFSYLKDSGKVKYFGVSNHNSMQIELLNKYLDEKICINQLQFGIMHTNIIDTGINVNMNKENAYDTHGSILEYCRINDITIEAWSPYQYGFFQGVFIDNPKFEELNKVLSNLAKKYNTTKISIATAWILKHPAKIQTIAGTTNKSRLSDIALGCNIELTKEEWYEIYKGAGNTLP